MAVLIKAAFTKGGPVATSTPSDTALSGGPEPLFQIEDWLIVGLRGSDYAKDHAIV